VVPAFAGGCCTTPGLAGVVPAGAAGQLPGEFRIAKEAPGRLQTTPKVWPLTTSIAPGVEGPKPVSQELSLIAKRCA
jgi:hypothetical protein